MALMNQLDTATRKRYTLFPVRPYMNRFLIVLALFVALPVTIAKAGPLRDAYAVAATYWHVPESPRPCGLRLVWRTIEEGFLAEAWPDARCAIVYNSSPAEHQMLLVDPETLCAVTVHELGHLLLGPTFDPPYVSPDTGEPDPYHSPDPHSIMYPYLNTIPRECRS